MHAIQEFAGSLLPFIVCCIVVAVMGVVASLAFTALGLVFLALSRVLL